MHASSNRYTLSANDHHAENQNTTKVTTEERLPHMLARIRSTQTCEGGPSRYFFLARAPMFATPAKTDSKQFNSLSLFSRSA